MSCICGLAVVLSPHNSFVGPKTANPQIKNPEITKKDFVCHICGRTANLTSPPIADFRFAELICAPLIYG